MNTKIKKQELKEFGGIVKTTTIKTQELAEKLADEILNEYCKSLAEFKSIQFLEVDEMGEDSEDKPIYGVNLNNGENGTLNFKGIEYKFSFTESVRVLGTLEELKHDTFTTYQTNYYYVSDLKVNGEADDELEDAINDALEDFSEGFSMDVAALNSALTDKIVKYIKYTNKKLA